MSEDFETKLSGLAAQILRDAIEDCDLLAASQMSMWAAGWGTTGRSGRHRIVSGVDRIVPHTYRGVRRYRQRVSRRGQLQGAVGFGSTPRPFQDHYASRRMVKGLSMERAAHRVASVTSVRPARRSAPMARLRRAAMALGPERVLTWDLSSW